MLYPKSMRGWKTLPYLAAYQRLPSNGPRVHCTHNPVPSFPRLFDFIELCCAQPCGRHQMRKEEISVLICFLRAACHFLSLSSVLGNCFCSSQRLFFLPNIHPQQSLQSIKKLKAKDALKFPPFSPLSKTSPFLFPSH